MQPAYPDEDTRPTLFHRVFLSLPPGADEQHLAALELLDYVEPHPEALPPFSRPYFLLAHDGTWLHLIDDCYFIYHARGLQARLVELVRARGLDMFRCTVGDCDESYDFSYYCRGELVREVQVSSPRFNDQIVDVDRGALLPFEREHGPMVPVREPSLLCLAASLGIQTHYGELELRRYVYRDPGTFVADFDSALA